MPERELEKKGHQVFISYSNENSDKTGSDREIADRICSALESESISCWIDHRDIMPGENWVNAMFNAVERSKLLVLVFSEDANRSQWVQDEITYALDEKIRIIPFRVDNVSPGGALRVLKVRSHWIDARQPLQQEDLNRLVGAVRNYLEKDKEAETETGLPGNINTGNNVEEEKETLKVKDKQTSWLNWSLVAASIIVLVLFYVIVLQKQQDDQAFKAAENKNKIPAYQEYLEKCPSGRYVKKVQDRIEKLQEMPEEVRYVASRASKGIKVEKNANEFWEADYGDGIIMVYIPAGTFTMGSEDGPDNEKPPHSVSLDGYWMGKYEVTKKQYMKFVNDIKSNYPQWLEKGNEYNIETGSNKYYKEFVSGENLPVIGISWHNAAAYCEWLSKKKELTFKLPTEAQWEMAAGGTESRKYPWGKDPPTGKKANFADIKLLSKEKDYSWSDKNIDDGFSYTAPVGSYPQGASPYGLLDMAGNVWEWCNDWYVYEYYKSSPGKNPEGPKSGTYRVLRGGSWFYGAGFLRCAFRSYDTPSDRYIYVGFRLCQECKSQVEIQPFR